MSSLGRIGVIVAARSSSTRLPGKALKPLKGVPMLLFLLRRLRTSCLTNEIILATSSEEEDNVLADLASSGGVSVYRGDLEDVVARYVGAARMFKLDTIVRVTADCPFVDGELVDYCLNFASQYSFDLCSTKGFFPAGLDVEIYRSVLMEDLHKNQSLTKEHREHLTLYFYHRSDHYKVVDIKPREDWIGKGPYMVDTAEDYAKMAALANRFETPFFSISSLVSLEHSG